MGRTPFLHNGERSSSLLFLIFKYFILSHLFLCHTWFPRFLFYKKRKREETPKREKNREALSLVIITYRDILFLYDGFTLIPSSFSIFLLLFHEKRKRKPVKGENREKKSLML
jgi:heme/copper-type cytochrome/quinol oxidase subunit 3